MEQISCRGTYMQVQEQSPQTEHTEAMRPALEEARGIYRVGALYGRLIYRLRWFVIAVWIAGVAASVPFAANVASVLNGGGYQFNGSESVHVGNLVIDKLHAPPSSVFVVFDAPDAQMSDPAYQSEIADFTTRAQSFAHVTGVIQGPVSADGHTTYLTVNFDKGSDYMSEHFTDFRKLAPTGSAATPARVYLTGSLAT